MFSLSQIAFSTCGDMQLTGTNQQGETVNLCVAKSVFGSIINGINIAQRTLQEKEGRSFATPIVDFGASLEVFEQSYVVCIHLQDKQGMTYKFSLPLELAAQLGKSMRNCLDPDSVVKHFGKPQ